ncbi:EF-P beta-lysylation protein EpmB [Arenimonas sp.]|uniref:EF-P beta-lysylation protein EpmB n=1 Tax=Arenimonas sp. TaxID=1872635 RepID=UPI0039E5006A
MIPAHPLPAQARSWQALWRDAVRDPRELLDLLGLAAHSGRVSEAAARQFELRVPRGFVAKMRRGDPDDPLLRQVLPVVDEERIVPGFGLDAVGDALARGATGLIHKYEGRALLIATGSCAVHCRYCFRRHFPYGEQTAAAGRWRDSLDYLRANPNVSEVLLSGGDPLSLATGKLVELTEALRELPQIRRLRLHTRLPIVLPERVDAELLAWLDRLPWPVAIVVHANHPNELGEDVARAMRDLRMTGATLLNQSVLLRGVNDEVGTLSRLSEGLFDMGVLPYYLHQLDRVAGTAHYEVSDIDARQLHAKLSARLPGYLLPRLVREISGEPGKTPL